MQKTQEEQAILFKSESVTLHCFWLPKEKHFSFVCRSTAKKSLNIYIWIRFPAFSQRNPPKSHEILLNILPLLHLTLFPNVKPIIPSNPRPNRIRKLQMIAPILPARRITMEHHSLLKFSAGGDVGTYEEKRGAALGGEVSMGGVCVGLQSHSFSGRLSLIWQHSNRV